MTTEEQRTVRHSSGLTAILTEEEYQKAHQSLPQGTLVYLDDFGNGRHTARVVEQNEDKGLTWVDTESATCAMSSPCVPTIKLTKVGD